MCLIKSRPEEFDQEVSREGPRKFTQEVGDNALGGLYQASIREGLGNEGCRHGVKGRVGESFVQTGAICSAELADNQAEAESWVSGEPGVAL